MIPSIVLELVLGSLLAVGDGPLPLRATMVPSGCTVHGGAEQAAKREMSRRFGADVCSFVYPGQTLWAIVSVGSEREETAVFDLSEMTVWRVTARRLSQSPRPPFLSRALPQQFYMSPRSDIGPAQPGAVNGRIQLGKHESAKWIVRVADGAELPRDAAVEVSLRNAEDRPARLSNDALHSETVSFVVARRDETDSQSAADHLLHEAEGALLPWTWDPHAAERTLRKALDVSPGNVECSWVLAQVLYELGRTVEAASMAREVAVRAPPNERRSYQSAAERWERNEIPRHRPWPANR